MHRFDRQKGVALIEFGVTVGVLMIVLFGITEFGRAIYQYNTLAKSARDAARYLSTTAPGDATAIGVAQCLAVYGNSSCTGSPLVPHLSVDMVSVCDASNCPANQAQGSAPVMNLVTLTIGGGNTPVTFNSAVPWVVLNIAFGPISATMRQAL